jgi:TolB-like protein/Tfp pilus assembly protein PilF
MTEESPNQTGSGSDVFVSYASQDAAVADTIVEALERRGVKCWIAPRDVIPGEFYAHAIVGAINATQIVLVVLTGNAVGSPHVLREIERASAKRHPLVSFRIDTASLPAGLEYFLSASHWLDATASGVDAALPKLVEAVQRLVAPKSAVEPAHQAATAAPVAGLFPQPSVAAEPKQRLSRPVIALSAVLALGLAYFAVDKLWMLKHAAGERPVAAVTPATSPAAPAISDKSVAVLPFVDMSEKKDQEYFSDGLSEELINMLTKVTDLRVPARTSSFYFKGKQTTIADIAKALGVAHVLEGSVRKSGNTLRITAQLVRVDNGYHVWSETYDRKLDDIFKVQDEIAGEVVRALKASLLERGVPGATPAVSTEAYNLFLQGQHFAARRTLADIATAIDYFEKAVQREPGYAEAWAALAFADAWQAQFGAGNVDVQMEKARLAARQAIRLNPKLPEAHATMALINSSYDFDWASARSETDLALSLDRSNPDALLLAGLIDWMFGRTDEAIARYREALNVDPLRADGYLFLGGALYSGGHLDEAADALRATMKLNPNQVKAHFFLALTELQHGRPQTARETMAAEQAPWYRLAGLAIVDHALGRKAESDSALAELCNRYGGDSAAQIAEAYAYRGEVDEAFKWLNRGYRQRDPGLRFLKVDPLFAALRVDPRYKAFLRKMKLPE